MFSLVALQNTMIEIRTQMLNQSGHSSRADYRSSSLKSVLIQAKLSDIRRENQQLRRLLSFSKSFDKSEIFYSISVLLGKVGIPFFGRMI